MKFLPIENISYNTRLKEIEIIERLADNIDTEMMIRNGPFGTSSTKSFEGRLKGETFHIRRIIYNRNSFLPIIHGIIEPDINGTVIKVKMKLPKSIIMFLCFICGFAGLAGVISFIISPSISDAILPSCILIFMYALTMGGFKSESKTAKYELQEIFDADIIEE